MDRHRAIAAVIAAVLVSLTAHAGTAAAHARLSDDPPAPPTGGIAVAGWVTAPETALERDAEEREILRLQRRAPSAELSATPLAVSAGLLQHTGAIVSVRHLPGGRAPRPAEREALGWTTRSGTLRLDDEDLAYEGTRTRTRMISPRGSGVLLLVRASALEEHWAEHEEAITAALGHLDRSGPQLTAAAGASAPPRAPEAAAAPPAADLVVSTESIAPVAGVPASVPPERAIRSAALDPAPAAVPIPAEPDPTPDMTAARQAILDRARAMLGTPYVWGGNVAGRGMDCSAYVSSAWGVSRYTTDSIGRVSHPITKAELRPGDAMNLTTGRDPSRRGHIRLFVAWGDPARTMVWVYEETPPRAVYRAIVYDDRYQPIRLNALDGSGETPTIAVPEPTRRPSTGTSKPTQKPALTYKPTPTQKTWMAPTVKPSADANRTAKPTAYPASTTKAEATPTAKTGVPGGASGAPKPRGTPEPDTAALARKRAMYEQQIREMETKLAAKRAEAGRHRDRAAELRAYALTKPPSEHALYVQKALEMDRQATEWSRYVTEYEAKLADLRAQLARLP